jgi:RNA polymerase sigma factor (sigma-70 family)
MSKLPQSENLDPNDPLTQLRRLSAPAEQEKLQTDAELLALYINGGDRGALELLIKRFAPMVASVCRLTVSDPASAEDAFQATFLILLKSANKIRRGTSIGAWLHGVAYRTACRIRTSRKKQLSNQSTREVITHRDPDDDPITELARRMELDALDRELEKLPERLRQPLIEHYLLGYSAPEIASRMDLSVSAVEGRLRRGRRALRTQLARRGVSLSVVLAGAGWFQQHVHAAEAVDWTSNFLDAHLPNGQLSPNVSSDPQISSLVRGEMTMFKNTLSTATVKALGVVAATLVAGALIAINVNANDPSDQPGNDGSLVMPAPDTPIGGTVMAQLGGGLGGMGSGAPRGKKQAAEGTVAQTEPQEPIEWERPTTDELDITPQWLSGGEASMVATENNRAVLAQEVAFDFREMALHEMIEWLNEQGLEAQFELNTSALEDLGIDENVEIKALGRGSVRELIRRTCDVHDLTYVVTESTIEITTKDDAEQRLSMRFYDLSYVLPNSASVNSVVAAIEQTIAPDMWMNNGGTSSISIVGSMMIVSATDTTHQNIEVLLLNLSKMNPQNAQKADYAPATIGGGFGGGSGLMGGGGGMF